jgi:FkbM family methyltransferase
MYLENKIHVIEESETSAHLLIDGKKLLFLYDKNLKLPILSILKGKEYHLLDLGSYKPEIIFDIGAHIGSSAVFFHANYPESLIFSYEPSSRNYRFLELNTRFFEKINIFNFGLFNETCNRNLYFGINHSGENSIFKSIVNSEKTESIKLKKFSEELAEKNISKISILKLDTEGCETFLLEDVIEKNIEIEQIFLEYHSENDRLQIDNLLKEKFILCYSTAYIPHRGTNMYISKKLIENFPNLDYFNFES